MNHEHEHKKVKKVTLGSILSWIFGVLFLLAGAGTIATSPVAGIIIVLASAMIIPYFDKILAKKGIEISGGIKFVLVIIILIALGFSIDTDVATNNSTSSSNTQSQQNTQTTQTSPSTQQEEEVKTTYQMNEPIELDYLTYKVLDAKSRTSVGDSEYFRKEAQGKYIIVDISVLNNANESKYIYTPRFKLVDQNNRKFDEDSEASLYLENSLSFGQQLQPGLETSGSIVFQVPKDATSFKLKIDGDWTSVSQVTVNLGTI